MISRATETLLQCLVRGKDIRYHGELIIGANNESKAVWSIMNNMKGGKQKTIATSIHDTNGNQLTALETAEQFNIHFTRETSILYQPDPTYGNANRFIILKPLGCADVKIAIGDLKSSN
ncbi:hypothetical protein JTB14_006344 [Gonioctena quinquepunctata]|nr:hypothetical protein JTB14_006344 [Gonioctena quinquepunctata]